ncbi:hypothetical protein Psi02_76080 [Planotetraspora silvatica]|uniref:Uncharacterized protein n=2 Tax=Planotetraspora silvatica TaxID=234614 RepID=A0A8J3XSF2_9ACTN|nr:hypothetical protein Psi02_76080 [Planotetraspora silvatica]
MNGEPKWFDTLALPDMTAGLCLENSGIIDSSITASMIDTGGGIILKSPLEEIRCIRNFVAHKNIGTLTKAQDYMRLPVRDVFAHIREKTEGGLPRFCHWIDSLGALAEASVY